MFCWYKLDFNNNVNINFNNLFNIDIKFLITKKKLASLVQVKKKSEKVKDLVEKCNYKI